MYAKIEDFIRDFSPPPVFFKTGFRSNFVSQTVPFNALGLPPSKTAGLAETKFPRQEKLELFYKNGYFS